MTLEQALVFVVQYLPQGHLNHLQEIVFQASWQGESYLDCAKTYGYSPEYIKAVGYKLWHLLSLAFNEKVTKNNFQSIIRRHFLIAQTELLDTQVKQANDQLISKNGSRKIFGEVTDRQTTVKAGEPWEEAADTSIFYGYAEELGNLEKWIKEKHCYLINIVGIEGIGKTALTYKLVTQIQGKFDCICWQSLYDAPSVEDLLAKLITYLSDYQETEAQLPKSIEGRILRLIDYLRSSHCLIVLDHLDSILNKNQNDSTDCRFQEYDVLWQRIGELEHQSTIILTSREKPKKIELLEGKSLPVRSLKLCGLKEAEGRAIFEEKGFFCETHSECKSIIEYYGGNPLFLKIVSSVIQNLFDSNLDKFIKYWKQDAIIFDDIRDIFNCQFDCLSDLEQSVIYWLAIYQQPVSLQELRDDLFLLRNKHKLLDALMSLQRRCLIDKVVAVNNQVHLLNITLQPVLAKFVLERFIEKICYEILVEETPYLVMSHPLVKAQNKDSIARGQDFPILVSIAERLLTLSQSYREIECKLNRMLLKINEKFYTLSGYGLENLFNISSQLNITLSGSNFSRLTVVQNEIPDANKLKLAQGGASKSRESVIVTTQRYQISESK